MKKDRFVEIQQFQDRLHKLNFEPMTWAWADKFFDLILEMMRSLNDKELVSLLKGEGHDQASVEKVFALKALQEYLSTRVEWYKTYKILFQPWDELEKDWETILKKNKK